MTRPDGCLTFANYRWPAAREKQCLIWPSSARRPETRQKRIQAIVALNSAVLNLSRSVGPTIAGALIVLVALAVVVKQPELLGIDV